MFHVMNIHAMLLSILLILSVCFCGLSLAFWRFGVCFCGLSLAFWRFGVCFCGLSSLGVLNQLMFCMFIIFPYLLLVIF